MISIIGAQVDLGASKKGVNMGPARMRFEGLAEKMDEAGILLEDSGDLVPMPGGRTSPRMHFYEAINELNAKIYREVTDAFRRGMFPLLIGGDHSCAAGSVAATSTYYKNIGVIWVDAHADFNDDKSTVSGNVHGMPLSAVCGQGPDSMIQFDDNVITVNPKKVVIVAGRDIEPQEWVKLNKCGVTVFTPEDIKQQGIRQIAERAVEIASFETEGIHLSFDIDALDPSDAPGVGTPVANGLSRQQAFEAAEIFNKSKKLLALDMVEINPVLDNNGSTARLANELIVEILK